MGKEQMITSSMPIIRLKSAFNKSDLKQTGDLCSNWPEIAIPAQKINLDNKTCFGYPDKQCLR